MSQHEKLKNLYEKLKNSQNNVSFLEVCKLAEMVGFSFDRQSGSHKVYRHEKYPGIMNFQDVKGKAKPYQVRQLINFIDDNKIIQGESNE